MTFDFVSLQDALNKVAKKAQWRITAFVLPPIDVLPLLVTLGVGALWY